MSGPVRVLVVDDHALVRETLAGRLKTEPDIEVIGTSPDATSALTEATRLRPDVVLMDIDMPGRSCFAAARAIRQHSPETRIIFLSGFFNDRYIEQALAVQAWGYVTKSESEKSLIEAIRKVVRGVAYFSPQVQARIVVDRHGARLRNRMASRISTLTDRETEVLRYLAQGMSKKEIAVTMGLSVNTVNRHTTSLMAKLNVHDRVELARLAIREGLAEP